MKRRNPATNKRVLARLLAEDLRNVEGAHCNCDDTPTVEITGGGSDITNTGPDGD